MGRLFDACVLYPAYGTGRLFHGLRHASHAGYPEVDHGVQQTVSSDMDCMLEPSGSAWICSKLLEERFWRHVLAGWLGNRAYWDYGGIAGAPAAFFKRSAWRIASFLRHLLGGLSLADSRNHRRALDDREDGDQRHKFRAFDDRRICQYRRAARFARVGSRRRGRGRIGWRGDSWASWSGCGSPIRRRSRQRDGSANGLCYRERRRR